MVDYIETIKALQSVVPKIDYKGLTEAVTVLNHVSAKLQTNWEEIEKSIGSQLEDGSSKWQTQIKTIPIFDFSAAEVLQKQFGSFQKMEGGAYSALSKIDTESITKVLKVSNPLADYDYGAMAKALQNSFIRTKEKQERNIENEPATIWESIVEEVQEEYNKDEAVIGKNSANKVSVENKKKITSEDVWRIIERIAIIITIIVNLRDIFGTTVTGNYNSVNETNNYYINELKIDADYWNIFQYRIVNQNNVMPRIKPDCTSRVMGHLSEGCVVQQFNKYRKWVQIYWKDEEGNDCSGWIQNYKLEEFTNN